MLCRGDADGERNGRVAGQRRYISIAMLGGASRDALGGSDQMRAPAVRVCETPMDSQAISDR